MIRKLKAGQYRLYSRKKDDSTGKRRNLGTFSTLEQAKQHEREVQYFKKHWTSARGERSGSCIDQKFTSKLLSRLKVAALMRRACSTTFAKSSCFCSRVILTAKKLAELGPKWGRAVAGNAEASQPRREPDP
jgi:hypothetical protein